jgi:class 3 adenylate cyclase
VSAPGLPTPSETERRVLRRIRAGPNVRLACQLRPALRIAVTPLLPPFANAGEGALRVDLTQGSEREVAILFSDIRGFWPQWAEIEVVHATDLEAATPVSKNGQRRAQKYARSR